MRITSSKILGILLALAMMMAARCYPVYASDDIGVGLRGPTRLFVETCNQFFSDPMNYRALDKNIPIPNRFPLSCYYTSRPFCLVTSHSLYPADLRELATISQYCHNIVCRQSGDPEHRYYFRSIRSDMNFPHPEGSTLVVTCLT